MLSKTAVSLAAAGAGICFVGYCIYFDHKRRSDPNFKEKLREKRRRAKQSNKSSPGETEIPDLRDGEAMQRFFLQEVQLGEELLAGGDIENGVEHLSNAVAVCGQPQQLLQVLQQTLPPQVFQLLIQRLPAVSKRYIECQNQREELELKKRDRLAKESEQAATAKESEQAAAAKESEQAAAVKESEQAATAKESEQAVAAKESEQVAAVKESEQAAAAKESEQAAVVAVPDEPDDPPEQIVAAHAAGEAVAQVSAVPGAAGPPAMAQPFPPPFFPYPAHRPAASWPHGDSRVINEVDAFLLPSLFPPRTDAGDQRNIPELHNMLDSILYGEPAGEDSRGIVIDDLSLDGEEDVSLADFENGNSSSPPQLGRFAARPLTARGQQQHRESRGLNDVAGLGASREHITARAASQAGSEALNQSAGNLPSEIPPPTQSTPAGNVDSMLFSAEGLPVEGAGWIHPDVTESADIQESSTDTINNYSIYTKQNQRGESENASRARENTSVADQVVINIESETAITRVEESSDVIGNTVTARQAAALSPSNNEQDDDIMQVAAEGGACSEGGVDAGVDANKDVSSDAECNTIFKPDDSSLEEICDTSMETQYASFNTSLETPYTSMSADLSSPEFLPGIPEDHTMDLDTRAGNVSDASSEVVLDDSQYSQDDDPSAIHIIDDEEN